MFRTVTAIILLVVVAASERGPVYDVKAWDVYEPGMTDFALSLAKACYESDAGQNVLVSPLSVLMALSMTANGAESETLAQMRGRGVVDHGPHPQKRDSLRKKMIKYGSANKKFTVPFVW